MNRQYPIYTESTDCQDCYKCVRHCPVKAIKIQNGIATIIPELCIACGGCVHTCPANAKKVRNDLGRVKNLLKRNHTVIASLAPSFIGEWPDIDPNKLAGALKQLGFHAVSETALGAEAVTHTVADQLKAGKPGLHISTACPVVVDFIRKYKPDFTPHLTPVLSPMLSHAQLLKAHYGPDCAVVFIGPCIAKKCESDDHSNLVEVALTFRDLAQWLDDEGIDLATITPVDFEPKTAKHGALYPLVGGMNKTLADYALPQIELMACSGMESLVQTLDNLDPKALNETVFLEALACPGGCIGGPQSSAKSLFKSELAVRRHSRDLLRPTITSEAVPFQFDPLQNSDQAPSELRIREALQRVGKYKKEDELNCGGCGYESCRAFARALITQHAEPNMCLSYLRKQAQKKANALLRCMPSGVVIVDQNLRIIECNENFARIAGADAQLAYVARPGMENADLKKLLPIHSLFKQVLEHGKEYHCEALRMDDKLLHVTVFPLEHGKIVGGILLDVTQSEMRREWIANRAREVIEKNMVTVQEIACQLGEHMADTEILLRSIADDYAPEIL